MVGLEIQSQIAEMAERSVMLNGLGNKVEIVCGDIKDAVNLFGAASFDAAVTNPPYMEKGGGLLNQSDAKAISRRELLCTLGDVISSAAGLLKPGGKFFMVHRPHRLADIIYQMRNFGIEPKQLRLVYPSPGRKPNLVLIGGPRMAILN